MSERLNDPAAFCCLTPLLPLPKKPRLVCFSHLRWDFVFQRPQHLLTRCARRHRVFVIEEPVIDPVPRFEVSVRQQNIHVVVPRLPERLSAEASAGVQATCFVVLPRHGIGDYLLWYYTPMALAFTRDLEPRAIVYDCMDELSAFPARQPRCASAKTSCSHAPTSSSPADRRCTRPSACHPNVHALPSSVDVAHFRAGARALHEPADQAHIPHPRLGFFGVVDERMDLELVRRRRGAAGLQIVVGPVVKIDPSSLPAAANIHYLGHSSTKSCLHTLPGWDVALLPFARNEATRYISPTKTPEYLAAGKPVVSTSIRGCDPSTAMGAMKNWR